MVGGWEAFSFNETPCEDVKSIQIKANQHCTSDSFPVIDKLWIQGRLNRAKEACLGLNLLVQHLQKLRDFKIYG